MIGEKNRLAAVSAAVVSLGKKLYNYLTRSYVLLLPLGVPTTPTVLLSRTTARAATRAPTRTTCLPPRCNSSVYVVLPGSWDITGGNERGVSLGLRSKEGVLEDVSALVDMRLLRAKQLVGPWCRRL